MTFSTAQDAIDSSSSSLKGVILLERVTEHGGVHDERTRAIGIHERSVITRACHVDLVVQRISPQFVCDGDTLGVARVGTTAGAFLEGEGPVLDTVVQAGRTLALAALVVFAAHGMPPLRPGKGAIAAYSLALQVLLLSVLQQNVLTMKKTNE